MDSEQDNSGTDTPALGFIGFSRTSHNGIPLPIDLTGMGMPGCSLATAIAVVLNLSTDPALTRAHVTAQFAIQDSAANAGGISTTEGLELVIR